MPPLILNPPVRPVPIAALFIFMTGMPVVRSIEDGLPVPLRDVAFMFEELNAAIIFVVPCLGVAVMLGCALAIGCSNE